MLDLQRLVTSIANNAFEMSQSDSSTPIAKAACIVGNFKLKSLNPDSAPLDELIRIGIGIIYRKNYDDHQSVLESMYIIQYLANALKK